MDFGNDEEMADRCWPDVVEGHDPRVLRRIGVEFHLYLFVRLTGASTSKQQPEMRQPPPPPPPPQQQQQQHKQLRHGSSEGSTSVRNEPVLQHPAVRLLSPSGQSSARCSVTGSRERGAGAAGEDEDSEHV